MKIGDRFRSCRTLRVFEVKHFAQTWVFLAGVGVVKRDSETGIPVGYEVAP